MEEMYTVEVKDEESLAYHKAAVLDYKSGYIQVRFENGWKPDEWVETVNVKKAPAVLEEKELKALKVGDAVEVLNRSAPDEPFGWWAAEVKAIRGQMYLISYINFDESYNEVAERKVIRPFNNNPSLDNEDIYRLKLAIPEDLQDWVNYSHFSNLTTESGALMVSLSRRHTHLLSLGSISAIKRVKMIGQLSFQRLSQIRKLEKQANEVSKEVSKFRKQAEKLFRCEFVLDGGKSGIGRAVGKKGATVKRARKLEGVKSVKVDDKTGKVTITAVNKLAANKARNMLDIVDELFSFPPRRLGYVIGKKGENIRQITKDSGVTRILVVNRGRIANRNNNRNTNRDDKNDGKGRKTNRNRREKDKDSVLKVTGPREAVKNAILLLQNHLKYAEEMDQLRRHTRDLNQELGKLSYEVGAGDNGLSMDAFIRSNNNSRAKRKNTRSNKSNSNTSRVEGEVEVEQTRNEKIEKREKGLHGEEFNTSIVSSRSSTTATEEESKESNVIRSNASSSVDILPKGTCWADLDDDIVNVDTPQSSIITEEDEEDDKNLNLGTENDGDDLVIQNLDKSGSQFSRKQRRVRQN